LGEKKNVCSKMGAAKRGGKSQARAHQKKGRGPAWEREKFCRLRIGEGNKYQISLGRRRGCVGSKKKKLSTYEARPKGGNLKRNSERRGSGPGPKDISYSENSINKRGCTLNQKEKGWAQRLRKTKKEQHTKIFPGGSARGFGGGGGKGRCETKLF